MANPSKESAAFADGNGKPLIGSRQTFVADIAVTYTAGAAPTPDGLLTVANSATPTVVELLEYCAELDAKQKSILDILEAHGLMADA